MIYSNVVCSVWKSSINPHTEQRTKRVSSGLSKQLGQIRSSAKNSVKAIHSPDGAVRLLKSNFISTIFSSPLSPVRSDPSVKSVTNE